MPILVSPILPTPGVGRTCLLACRKEPALVCGLPGGLEALAPTLKLLLAWHPPSSTYKLHYRQALSGQTCLPWAYKPP